MENSFHGKLHRQAYFRLRHTPLETLQRSFMKNKWTQGEKTEAKVIE